MGSYMYLICLVVFTTLNCRPTGLPGEWRCYENNPLSINGTQLPSVLRCPDKCNCSYCGIEGIPWLLQYTHIVDCTYFGLSTIPSKDTVPTDAGYYLLDNNYIWSLKNNSFKTSPALELLDLSLNGLTYKRIEPDAFRGLRKLKFFMLSGNLGLRYLLADWFVDLVSLDTLHVTNCQITTVRSGVFKHCKKLTEINLQWNGIMSLPATVFQNLPSLTYLYLAYNKLGDIPNQAFAGSNKLRFITLNDNSLATISENIGLQTIGELQVLNVSHNKFTCDCNLVWFRNWIDKNYFAFLDIGRAKCFSPSSKVYLKLMDFDPNKLHCNKLIRVLIIGIPPASAAVAIAILVFLLYYFRYDLRYWNQRRRLRRQYQQLDNQGPPPINGENIRYDAFVAYNSKDQQWVLSVLQPSLETERNFKLCVDYRDFIPGEAVVDNIADAVKYSRKVLLVVSKNFAKSEWCYFELEMARMRMFDNHEDILVVVLLEKVSAKDMPILLHKILTKKTYIEWKEHPEGQALFWAKLEAALLSPNCPRDRLLDYPRD